jgi:hypothetical protein
MDSAFFSLFLGSWLQKLLEHVRYSYTSIGTRKNGVANSWSITSIVANCLLLLCSSLQITTTQAVCFLADAIHIHTNNNIPLEDLHNSSDHLLSAGCTWTMTLEVLIMLSLAIVDSHPLADTQHFHLSLVP